MAWSSVSDGLRAAGGESTARYTGAVYVSGTTEPGRARPVGRQGPRRDAARRSDSRRSALDCHPARRAKGPISATPGRCVRLQAHLFCCRALKRPRAVVSHFCLVLAWPPGFGFPSASRRPRACYVLCAVFLRVEASTKAARSQARYRTAPRGLRPYFTNRGPPPRRRHASKVSGSRPRNSAASVVFIIRSATSLRPPRHAPACPRGNSPAWPRLVGASGVKRGYPSLPLSPERGSMHRVGARRSMPC